LTGFSLFVVWKQLNVEFRIRRDLGKWNPSTSRSGSGYLHPAQEEEEQPPQPELLLEDEDDDELFEDLPMPKRDMSFSVFFEPHFSHATSGFEPKTSFSKSVLQSLQ
jgi:hypothetical protein